MKNKNRTKAGHKPRKEKLVMIALNRQQQPVQYSQEDAFRGVEELLVANRHLEAIYVLEQMCRQLKKEKRIFVELLRVYVACKQLDSAKDLSQLMLKKFPGVSDVLIQVASYYQAVGDTEQAISCLKKSLVLNPKNLNGIHLLGITYQGVGDKKKSVDCFNKILNVDPDNAFAIFAKARIEKSSVTSEFRKRVDDLIGRHELSGQGQELALLYFSSALIYEGLDSGIHFERLKKANSVAKTSRPWGEEEERLRNENNHVLFKKTVLDRISKMGDAEFQPIFIAAMPRSGTTLLEQVLGAHTSTYCVGENAPFEAAVNKALLNDNPIARRLSQNSGPSLDNIARYQEAILEIAQVYRAGGVVSAADERRIVDKAVVNHAMIGIILLTFPNASIIHLQRHPLDIIYSCYQQYFGAGHNYSFDLKSLAQYYKIYVSSMEHWKSLFPERIYTVRYEELIATPELTLRSLLEFCGLPWQEGCLNYREAMGSINTSSDDQVRRPIYQDSIEKWKTVEAYLKPAADELGEYLIY